MPMLIVMLNNYEAFTENYEMEYEDILLTITREGLKCGIVFIVTASTYSDMRYRLTQNFKRKIALQVNNEDDYFNIFENVGKKRPPRLFGRGLVSMEDGGIYEFQTAKICEAINYNEQIQNTIEQVKAISKLEAKPVPIIPNKINLSDFKDYINGISHIPIGMTKKELKVYTYDFKKNFVTMITSKNVEDAVEFSLYILEEIRQVEDIELVVIDAERTTKNKKENLKKLYSKFKLDFVTNEDSKHFVCAIIGLDKFLSDYEEEEEFFELFKAAEEMENCNFILIDNTNKLKNHEYDEWYKEYIAKDNGIYVGNGMEDQYLLDVSERKDVVNNCGKSYGYVIKQGNPIMIKLLGMKDEVEEDE